MLVVETIAKIRRLYFAQGRPIKESSREIGLSRKVVKKVIRSGKTGFPQRLWDFVTVTEKNGGWYRDRTCDPYHVKVVLYR
jgi:hypothetical protein